MVLNDFQKEEIKKNLTSYIQIKQEIKDLNSNKSMLLKDIASSLKLKKSIVNKAFIEMAKSQEEGEDDLGAVVELIEQIKS